MIKNFNSLLLLSAIVASIGSADVYAASCSDGAAQSADAAIQQGLISKAEKADFQAVEQNSCKSGYTQSGAKMQIAQAKWVDDGESCNSKGQKACYDCCAARNPNWITGLGCRISCGVIVPPPPPDCKRHPASCQKGKDCAGESQGNRFHCMTCCGSDSVCEQQCQAQTSK